VSDIVRDPAEAEANLIDLRASLLAERNRISKFSAYRELLSRPEGLRLLADLTMVQKRYEEEKELRATAQEIEEFGPYW
jgi:hypothetical protein